MLEHHSIDESEGIDVNKTNEPCRCIICNYNFLKVNFRLHPEVCNGRHIQCKRLWVLMMLQLFLLKE